MGLFVELFIFLNKDIHNSKEYYTMKYEGDIDG